MHESESKKGCKHQDRLKGKPDVYITGQIRKRHGEVKERRCVRAK
jgi:hypothetical protein